MKFIILGILLIYSLDLTDGQLRKFRQNDFDKWLDENNFLVILFCQSIETKACKREMDALKRAGEQLSRDYNDIVVGYIEKDNDAILFSRYNIQKLPFIKIFPYNASPVDYSLSVRIEDVMKEILKIRKTHFEVTKKQTSTKKSTSSYKSLYKDPIMEIDWLDMPATVKSLDHHAVLIIYDEDCGIPCEVMDRVAKVFVADKNIKFYRMNFNHLGQLKETIHFVKNPTVFWYPLSNKETGFVYGGTITFDVMVEFINDNAGLYRDLEGNLKHTAGRIAEIDQIIKENIINILLKNNIDYVLFRVTQKAKDLPHAKEFINYYIAVLKEMQKKNEDADKILEREQKFIMKRMTQTKQNNTEWEYWNKYYNIISAFVEYAAVTLSDGKSEYYEVRGDPYLPSAGHYSSHHDEL